LQTKNFRSYNQQIILVKNVKSLQGHKNNPCIQHIIITEVYMYKATYKSPQVEAMLTAVTGVDRVKTIESGHCVNCSLAVSGFKNDICLQEYLISGRCQVCQDVAFDNPDHC